MSYRVSNKSLLVFHIVMAVVSLVIGFWTGLGLLFFLSGWAAGAALAIGVLINAEAQLRELLVEQRRLQALTLSAR